MSQHTPGSFAFEVPPADAHTDPDIQLDQSVKFWIVDTDHRGEGLALVLKTADGQEEGNARLFAAAPDLLAALTRIAANEAESRRRSSPPTSSATSGARGRMRIGSRVARPLFRDLDEAEARS